MPPENFDFIDTPDRVWINTPEYEFIKARSDTSGVVVLCNARAVNITDSYLATKNLSTTYRATLVIGGVLMRNTPASVRIGYADSIKVRMEAENAETGEIVNLTQAQMQDIKRIKLVIGTGAVLDSDTPTIGLGAGKVFDNTVDDANAVLLISMGTNAALADLAGDYEDPHLAVYFNSVDSGNSPVSCLTMPISVIAADT